jgi:hypothetical protein
MLAAVLTRPCYLDEISFCTALSASNHRQGLTRALTSRGGREQSRGVFRCQLRRGALADLRARSRTAPLRALLVYLEEFLNMFLQSMYTKPLDPSECAPVTSFRD